MKDRDGSDGGRGKNSGNSEKSRENMDSSLRDAMQNAIRENKFRVSANRGGAGKPGAPKNAGQDRAKQGTKPPTTQDAFVRSAFALAANAFQNLKKGFTQFFDGLASEPAKSEGRTNRGSEQPQGNARNRGRVDSANPQREGKARASEGEVCPGMQIAGTNLISYSGKEKVIHIPDGIRNIVTHAFANNPHIERVFLPESVWSIGAGAFQNCTSLCYVELPNNELLNILESAVFKGCSSLTSIRWSPRIKLIRADCLEGCPLSGNCRAYFEEQFVFSERRNAYVTRRIANSERYGDANAPYYPPTGTETSQKPIPSKEKRGTPGDTAQQVAAPQSKDGMGLLDSLGSFIDRTLLQRSAPARDRHNPYLYIVDGELVGFFDDVPYPEDLVIPASVREVGTQVFNLIPGMRSVVFKGKIERIASHALSSMSPLKTLVFEGPVEYIGSHAFKDCTSLRTVRFLDSVGCVEPGAFSGCKSLESVYFGGTLGDLWHSCFEGCTSLVELDIPDSCQNIGRNCFSRCEKLARIHLPSGLRRIWDKAFHGCTSLQEFAFPPEYVIDKHRYPIVDPFAFAFVLNDDYWEEFILRDGVWKRTLALASSEDPDGLFDMMLAGEASTVRRIPQILMNARLNRIWELAFMRRELYAVQMGILRVCLSVAEVILSSCEDDRADRLFVLEYIAKIQELCVDCKERDLPRILPCAIGETLYAICGRGNIRKKNDAKLVEQVKTQLGVDSVAKVPIDVLLYRELHIGPWQRNRYNPWKTQNDIPIDLQTVDYYTFCHEMNILVESVFDAVLDEPVEPTGDPESRDIDAWCWAWNRLIHEELSPDAHVVLFHPSDYESEPWAHESEIRLGFLVLLTMSQIHAIRGILAQYGLEGMMTSYTLGNA